MHGSCDGCLWNYKRELSLWKREQEMELTKLVKFDSLREVCSVGEDGG